MILGLDGQLVAELLLLGSVTGFLAGLLAQPALQSDPLKTIAYAVWQHGTAADKLTAERKNWVVEDLAEIIGGVAADEV
jgi:NAD(P)H-hydrate repair Nnr-like enzyme with NAD(P)H-hydrate dehydratase domain